MSPRLCIWEKRGIDRLRRRRLRRRRRRRCRQRQASSLLLLLPLLLCDTYSIRLPPRPSSPFMYAGINPLASLSHPPVLKHTQTQVSFYYMGGDKREFIVFPDRKKRNKLWKTRTVLLFPHCAITTTFFFSLGRWGMSHRRRGEWLFNERRRKRKKRKKRWSACYVFP